MSKLKSNKKKRKEKLIMIHKQRDSLHREGIKNKDNRNEKLIIINITEEMRMKIFRKLFFNHRISNELKKKE